VCPRCGFENQIDAKFCNRCGVPLSIEEAAIKIVDSESRVEMPYGKQSLEINNTKNSNPKIIQQTIDYLIELKR